jgi:mannose-1-phosphate guanylyltransferase
MGGVMRTGINTWAVVLAGGDGNRLKELTTTPSGHMIPKQFCSFHRESCLLEDAIGRAAKVAMLQHICSVVAAKHRRWWPASLKALPQQNILVQPCNRGTAHGILFALLQIQRRAPDSIILMLPADHYVVNEPTMARSLRIATNLAADNSHLVYVLGAEPDCPDQELGYIVPNETRHDAAAGVLRFVEKPSIDIARVLISEGALWNTFIFAGSVRALLSMFQGRYTSTIKSMRDAIALTAVAPVGSVGLELLYQDLGNSDFSKDVLECHDWMLQVLRVPPCGWTDLGTPARVAETVQKLALESSNRPQVPRGSPFLLDLAAQRPRERVRAAG